MRVIGLVLVLGWAASAQAAGEFCSQLFPSGTPLASLALAFSTAAPGSVLCLARGGTYTGTTGVTFQSSLASAQQPILICSATGNQCSSDGGANARLTITSGDGITLGAGARFITLRDIDLVGGGGGTGGVVFAHGNGTPATNITVEGGGCSGFGVCALSDPSANALPPTNIRFGSCAAPWQVRDTTDARGALFGAWQSTSFAVDVAGARGPGLVLDSGAREEGVGALVVECSRFGDAVPLASVGAMLQVSGRVADLTVQRTVFDASACGSAALGVATSHAGLASEWATLHVFESTFHTSCAWDVICGFCENSTFFNNVFTRRSSSDARGAIAFFDGSEALGRVGGNAVFNNTFVDLTGTLWSDALLRFDAAQGANRVYNNLFYLTGTDVHWVEGCSQLGGASGTNFNNNFLFTPDDILPGGAGCPGGTGNSLTFDVDPGLTDVASGDYTITARSAVAGQGTSTGAPPVDFAGAPRPTPPSIGAFDVNADCVGEGCGPGGGIGTGGGRGDGAPAGDIKTSGCAAGEPSLAWVAMSWFWALRRRRAR